MICLDTIPVLAGQTVNDARGRYEITIDAAGRHYQQACIEIDVYLTQRKFSINEAFPADRKYTIKDFDWPKSARWQDSRTDINRVLNGVRDARGDPHRVLNPTVPAQQGQKPAGTEASRRPGGDRGSCGNAAGDRRHQHGQHLHQPGQDLPEGVAGSTRARQARHHRAGGGQPRRQPRDPGSRADAGRPREGCRSAPWTGATTRRRAGPAS